MRVLFSIIAVAALLAGAASASCVAPLGYVYPSATTACPVYHDCGATFCVCVGARNNNTNASTCLADSVSATCALTTTCMAAYHSCILGIAQYSTNTSSPCFVTGTSLQVAALSASASFQGSTLQLSCRHHKCNMMNNSGGLVCTFGVNDSLICLPPPTAAPSTVTSGPTAAPPPPTATEAFVAAIVATVRIEGSAFQTLLDNNRTGLEESVASDLGGLLSIARSAIRITYMTIGSLVVTFAVSAAAGVQPVELTNRLAAANATNWLTSTQALYSTVSNETLRVTVGPTIVSTAAPGAVTSAPGTTGSPGTSGSPSAAVASLLAVVAAAAVSMVALF